MSFNITFVGIFRQLEKLNTPLAGKWRVAALCISFCSIVINLSLGVIYFGKYNKKKHKRAFFMTEKLFCLHLHFNRLRLVDSCFVTRLFSVFYVQKHKSNLERGSR